MYNYLTSLEGVEEDSSKEIQKLQEGQELWAVG